MFKKSTEEELTAPGGVVALERRVQVLEAQLKTFRIGEPIYALMCIPGWTDNRPELTVRQVVEMLIEAQGLELTATPAIPQQFRLQKKGKK